MSIETLPVELLNHIIEAAAPPVTTSDTVEERYRTLLACSLVSRRWVRVAQRLLFAEAAFPTSPAAQAFLATTADHPHFANHVRLFKVYELGRLNDAASFRSFRSLREVYVGKLGEIDLAVLTGLHQLETLSVWLAKVTCSGDPASAIFPVLKTLSTCYAYWVDRARQVISPDHLPALCGLAFYHQYADGQSRSGINRRVWRVDLSAFPPSLRLAVSTTARYTCDRRHKVLHETEVDDLYEALDAGYFENGSRPADLEHLRITQVCDVADGHADGHKQLLVLLKQMPKIKSLFICSKELTSTDASLRHFAEYVRQRGIRHIELESDNQHLEGSLILPQWMEM
ncbi:Proteophosphoglycan ppg4 [Rhodotorula toruloides ATCC 204091]|uniref:Proteophosphoglycan ppg4 n=1 Tax=Rhodotorula toruloides TaxID=5286 RepID=A0A0K3CU19_RHOTO|nr:Proteophosphoglycan ppg4 [Rhodotorula toruloides ATCC 204091]KAK4330661.1 Proteophosphoglycan ppg4 [Rhodotorula toruloides]PRQ70774.1 Proteophosphoglycan ppg4 [Rhodotorula toruloides]